MINTDCCNISGVKTQPLFLGWYNVGGDKDTVFLGDEKLIKWLEYNQAKVGDTFSIANNSFYLILDISEKDGFMFKEINDIDISVDPSVSSDFSSCTIIDTGTKKIVDSSTITAGTGLTNILADQGILIHKGNENRNKKYLGEWCFTMNMTMKEWLQEQKAKEGDLYKGLPKDLANWRATPEEIDNLYIFYIVTRENPYEYEEYCPDWNIGVAENDSIIRIDSDESLAYYVKTHNDIEKWLRLQGAQFGNLFHIDTKAYIVTQDFVDYGYYNWVSYPKYDLKKGDLSTVKKDEFKEEWLRPTLKPPYRVINPDEKVTVDEIAISVCPGEYYGELHKNNKILKELFNKVSEDILKSQRKTLPYLPFKKINI